MNRLLFLSILLLGAMSTSRAQSFVYHPANPNFGGNTFNYSWMLSSAQAQDRNVDPATRRNAAANNSTTSTLDAYSQSLQNQLLSRITSNVVGQQFGESSLKPGTYKFGDFQVEISNGTNGTSRLPHTRSDASQTTISASRTATSYTRRPGRGPHRRSDVPPRSSRTACLR